MAYTDADTGIIFDSWTNPAGTMKFGFTFPSDALTVDATEFIGVLVSEAISLLWPNCIRPNMSRNAPLPMARARDGADCRLAAQ